MEKTGGGFFITTIIDLTFAHLPPKRSIRDSIGGAAKKVILYISF